MPKFGNGNVSNSCSDVTKFFRLSASALVAEYRLLRSSAKSTLVCESTCAATVATFLSAPNASTILSRFLLSTSSAPGSESSVRPRLSLLAARIAENRSKPSMAATMSLTWLFNPAVNSASRGTKSTNWLSRPATAL